MKTLTQNDSWLILSPKRTGSILLAATIGRIYFSNNINLKWITSNEKIEEIPNTSIVHIHSMNFPYQKNVNYIVNYRNPINITLSELIRPHIGAWHLTKDEASKISINSFVLNPIDFLLTYSENIKWYKNIPKEFLSIATFINYNDFSIYPNVQIPLLLNLPPLTSFNDCDDITVKNPGTPKDWIKNWDQIQNIINSIKLESEEFIESFVKMTLE
jgi:hypothetical protein